MPVKTILIPSKLPADSGDFSMTPGQCRAARSWLKWSTRKTAQESGVARATLVRFENGRDVMHSSVTRLRKTFEAAGVVFSGNFTVSYEPGKEAKAPRPATRNSRSQSFRRSPRAPR